MYFSGTSTNGFWYIVSPTTRYSSPDLLGWCSLIFLPIPTLLGEWTRTPILFGLPSQVNHTKIDVESLWSKILLTHNVSKIKQPYFQELPYGLRCPRNATRGLQSVVQAFIIKHFLFDMRPKQKSIPLDQMLKPTEVEQQTALWTAISEILWNVGERQKVVLVLPGDLPHIQHSHSYFQDSVTEKLYFFEFLSREELQIFVKRYLVRHFWVTTFQQVTFCVFIF